MDPTSQPFQQLLAWPDPSLPSPFSYFSDYYLSNEIDPFPTLQDVKHLAF